ncbi:chitin synthase chs-2-like [Lissotriton helveticus]
MYAGGTFPHKFRRSWDPFLLKPVDSEEEKTEWCPLFINNLICVLLGLLVCALGFFSKASFLLMVTLAGPKPLHFSRKPLALLIIGAMLVFPNLLTLVKCLWTMTFKNSKFPSWSALIVVCLLESVAALCTAVLTIVSMPHFNILSNTMILNGACFVPSILQIIQHMSNPDWKTSLPALSIVFTLLGFILFGVGYHVDLLRSSIGSSEMSTHIPIAAVAVCFASINWWENFTTFSKNGCLQHLKKNLDESRNVRYMCSSVIRILVTGAVVGSSVPIMGENWSTLTSASWDEVNLAMSLFGIQALSSVLCHWFGVVACKMHSLKCSFIFPMLCTTLTVILTFTTVFGLQYKEAEARSGDIRSFDTPFFCHNLSVRLDENPSNAQLLLLEISHNICNTTVVGPEYISGFALLGVSGLCWWVGLLLSTYYVWKLELQRIERTTTLFVRRLYEAAFIDQSMLLNINVQNFKEGDSEENTCTTEKVNIYLCATMWHETFDEMLKIITSMYRLDKYRPRNGVSGKEKFDFEAHIYFDDAFLKETEGLKERRVNTYVECLATAVEEVHRVFTYDKETQFSSNWDTDASSLRTRLTVTPYGGQLQYTLPNGNFLYVHLKDKDRIRHKKRWSQIMYLYYLLGWKLYRDAVQGTESQETMRQELQIKAKNTYILALDGDTDFQPSSLLLLVDRLRMYPNVGAACGRIHPTGVGPMVWYQKFEYAVAHWLQKSSEHVLGCVLCSPGCFSLFRAAALMDDNVLKMYTTKATEASHFVQYDQGEDRWLCTLLLQQGWRVEYNAASDAFTNAPQEFKEFYNQRRRWGPSTMANTLDLLHKGKEASQKNTSISTPFILYQIMTMGSSILSPATVCLMIAGALSFVFHWNGNLTIVLAIIPPALYLLVCFVTKPDTQITVAAYMSIGYAFLMTATFLSIIGDMVQEETFMTPTGLFLIFMSLLYVVTAMLHPKEFHLLIYGLLYIICVPSGYLLMTIYSMANLHVVSWGTRETSTTIEVKKEEQDEPTPHAWYQKKWQCFCWDIEMQVRNNNYKMMPSTKKTQIAQLEDAAPQESQETEAAILQENPIQSKESWIEQLNEKSRCSVFQEENLPEDAREFWESLMSHYLEPIKEDKATQERIESDLKSLRNKTTFIYFMMNLLWIGATFFLQLIGPSIHIKLPKMYSNGTISTTEHLSVEPIGFMFLLSFAALLLLQFLALLYHRVYTFIHFVAYQGTAGQGNNLKSGKRNSDPAATSTDFINICENDHVS